VELEVLHDTFLGLPPEACAYKSSRVVLVRAPYDGTASYAAGARNGPAAIMSASTQVELYDLELERESCEVGIHNAPSLLPSAAGPEDMIARVEQACAAPLLDGKFVVALGGEHSIALGAARAAHARYGSLSFLQIDAHLDLRDSYEGSRFSHACVARRLLELGRVTAVGPRVGCTEELECVRAQGLRPVWGHELTTIPQDEWIGRVVDQLGLRVYVTLDVDGLDPSVIPATGTPVPGGLSWHQTLALLRAVGSQREVVGCDICELAPIPGHHASDFATAMLVYKMIGYFVPPPPKSGEGRRGAPKAE
jgi:agmatinase